MAHGDRCSNERAFCLQAVRLGYLSQDRLAALQSEAKREPACPLRERVVAELHGDKRVIAEIERAAAQATLDSAPIPTASSSATTLQEVPERPKNPALLSTLGLDTEALQSLTSDAEVTPECPDRYEPLLNDAGGSEIGRGGIGRVLAVRDRHLGRSIALKELLPAVMASASAASSQGKLPTAAIRFLREARVTGQLEHPNIVPVHELGRRAQGAFYYTMKHVRGRTLALALRQATGFSERIKLLSHYADLCHAIAYAHSRGVIHRDIKTANVMLGEFGETLVLDWGLAKVTGLHEGDEITSVDLGLREVPQDLTVAGSIMGTPAYMSPEQASGNADLIDERSDVWALGIVLYEILTGETPFQGANVGEIARRICSEAPRSPRELEEQVPAELSSICLKALSRSPQDRYPSAQALAAEIESFQTGARVHAHDYTSWEHLKRFAAKNKPLLAGAVLALLSMLAALIVAITFYAREKSARQQAQLATQRETAALTQERRERLLASYHIAQGVEERALRAAHEGAWPVARIYAAASLVKNPASPRSPSASPEFVAAIPASDRLLLSALSRYHQATAYSTLAYQRSLLGAQKLTALAFSPDGRRVAATGSSKTVYVWDAKTGQSLLSLQGFQAPGSAISFSPEGNRLVASNQTGELRVWNAHSGDLISSWQAHAESVDSIAASPDGKLFASASQDKTIALWDAKTLRKRGVLEGHEGSVHGVAFSPTNRLLASASRDKTIRLWDLSSRTTTKVLVGHSAVVRGVAFSPDGSRVASASYDKTIRVWDVAEGKLLWTGEGFKDEVLDVAFSPTGDRIASASWDHTVGLWDAASGVLLTKTEGHSAAAWAVAFSPEGSTLASAGEDHRVRLWTVQAGAAVLAAPKQGYLWATRFSPRGRLAATAGADGDVRLWELSQRKLLHVLSGHTDLVADLCFSPEGSLIASAGYDKTVRLWDVASARLVRTLVGHEGFVRAVAFDPEGQTLASASQDQTVIVWDVATGRNRFRLSGHTGPVRGVAFSPKGKWVASAGNDGTVRIWDSSTGAPVATWSHGTDALVGIAFASNGSQAASAGADGNAIVWDTATGKQQQVLKWHAQGLYAARFSPEDRLLATASDDRTVALWVLGQRRPSLLFESSQSVVALDYAPAGNSLLIGDGSTARVVPVDLSTQERDPLQLLREAEQEAGLRLDGFAVTLVD